MCIWQRNKEVSLFMTLYLKGRLTQTCVSSFLISHYSISFVPTARKMTLIYFILSINRLLLQLVMGRKLIACGQNGQTLWSKALVFFSAFLARKCFFCAPTWSTLICYNAELHSRLTIWSSGRIRSGPLARKLVAWNQYRWSNSLIVLPFFIS